MRNSIETTVSFSEFNLQQPLIENLEKIGFSNASKIQELIIPLALEGKDVFAQAKTGSGKTGSFAIPILEKILINKEERYISVVLSPTRELAQQTFKVFTELSQGLDIHFACLIGGESFDKQKDYIEKDPQVIVATPGRLCDLIRQKMIDIKKCQAVVFDEADRLFDMGFQKDIEYILSNVSVDRQLIMVSATSHLEVLKTAYKYKSHPEEVRLNADDLLVDKINHQVAMISKDEKMSYLVHLLRDHEDAYTIIFCNTQYMAHLVSTWLEKMDFKVKAISGKLPQNKRTKLMEEFRSKKVTTLVCTDVAARGLDIEGINLVINYDLPNEAANYVHRIGRTGRAGKSGRAISFCAFEDCQNLDLIHDYLDAKIELVDIENEHFATDLCRRPHIDQKTFQEVDPREQRRDYKKNDRRNSKYDKGERIKRTEDKIQNFDQVYNAYNPKFFDITETSTEQAKVEALKYFGLQDTSILESKVIKVGRKKFFFFGPRPTTYQFSVTPFYRKILLPFYKELFKKMGLDIYINVSFKDSFVRVFFSGRDADVLIEGRSEVKRAVEELSKIILSRKIKVPKNLKISFYVESNNDKKKRELQLEKNLEQIKKKVLETKSPVLMDSLNPAERRIIHQLISEDNKFQSESKGEGRFKRIEISLK